jgi:hypothetical protein
MACGCSKPAPGAKKKVGKSNANAKVRAIAKKKIAARKIAARKIAAKKK